MPFPPILSFEPPKAEPDHTSKRRVHTPCFWMSVRSALLLNKVVGLLPVVPTVKNVLGPICLHPAAWLFPPGRCKKCCWTYFTFLTRSAAKTLLGLFALTAPLGCTPAAVKMLLDLFRLRSLRRRLREMLLDLFPLTPSLAARPLRQKCCWTYFDFDGCHTAARNVAGPVCPHATLTAGLAA
jgi:hypothetical protein